jgi:cell division septum initiation protein DivIVA
MVASPGDHTYSQKAPWAARPDAPIADIADRRNGGTDPHPLEASGSEVQWVNSELHTIASTIEDLQSRLAQANSRLDAASKVETTEVEIGRLFVEAQQFCDDSLASLEMRVHEILLEADNKAKQMIVEANAEAQEIRRNAQQAAFASTETVRELQAAIAGFTRVNADLLTELGTLNSMLLPDEASRLAGHNPSPDASQSIGSD